MDVLPLVLLAVTSPDVQESLVYNLKVAPFTLSLVFESVLFTLAQYLFSLLFGGGARYSSGSRSPGPGRASSGGGIPPAAP